MGGSGTVIVRENGNNNSPLIFIAFSLIVTLSPHIVNINTWLFVDLKYIFIEIMESTRTSPTLLSNQRQSEILRVVQMHGTCRIGDLAVEFDVSGETIRRNIKPLVERGLVRRVHGGITLPEQLHEPPFSLRMQKNQEAKRRIAARAAELIQDGDSLLMDTGSTTAYIALALCNHSNLLVVTNSIEIARTLATRNGNRVHMAGGEVRADDCAAFGQDAIHFVSRFEVRYAILSIGAININCSFMDFHLCEGEFSRAMINQAEQTMVVADYSKFGQDAAVKVCDAGTVDLLITDRQPPAGCARILHKAGTRIVIA